MICPICGDNVEERERSRLSPTGIEGDETFYVCPHCEWEGLEPDEEHGCCQSNDFGYPCSCGYELKGRWKI